MADITPESTLAKLEASQSHEGIYSVCVGGVEMRVHPGVYSPKYFKGTETFIKHLEVRKGEHWLDIGTGIGAIAIHAALKGAGRIVAADINSLTANNVDHNVSILDLKDKVTFYESDLFEKIRPERFHTISFNQPLSSDIERSPTTMLERAVFDPGYETFRRFLKDAGNYLCLGGRILIGSSSTIGDEELLRSIISKEGYVPRVIGVNEEAQDRWQGPITYNLVELLRYAE